MLTNIILFIGVITNIILGVYIGFFKSYASKKGENLATKEDIGDLTRIVKNVESEFSVLHEKQVGFQVLKRTAIIDFHDKASSLMSIYVNIRPDSFKDTATLDYQIETWKLELESCYNRLELLWEGDQKVLDLARKIVIQCTLYGINVITRVDNYSKNVTPSTGIILTKELASVRKSIGEPLRSDISELTTLLREELKAKINRPTS